jgi:hypothetical protein
MEGVSTYLFTQGVLGIALLVVGYVCIKLYNKTEKQQLRIEELQELRLTDTKEVTQDVTAVVQGNADAIRILTEKIELAKK